MGGEDDHTLETTIRKRLWVLATGSLQRRQEIALGDSRVEEPRRITLQLLKYLLKIALTCPSLHLAQGADFALRGFRFSGGFATSRRRNFQNILPRVAGYLRRCVHAAPPYAMQ